ncbi:Putative 1-phosphatidylinositol-3-phosphate 5-kinase FAB1C [Linum perenne]
MGIPDTSLLEKVKSWIAWGGSDLSPPSSESAVFKMHSSSVRMCSECNTSSDELFNGYHCHSCGRWVCHKCIKELVSHLAVESSGAVQNVDCEEPIKFCKFCGVLKISEKVHPANSPRESPEPPSPSFSGESIQDDRLARYLESRDCGYSPLSVTCNNMTAIVPHPCLASVRCSRSRGGDEEQADDSDKHFHSPSNEYASDVDSSSMSSRLEFCSFKSVGSSPFDSPSSGTDFTSYSRLGHAAQQGQEDSPLSLRDGPLDQENMAVLRRPDTGAADPDNMDDCSDDLSASRNQYEKSRKPWDFESNGLIWSPPLPVDENDDAETNFFSYDDDDDYFAGDSVTFSASSSLSRNFSAKERDTDGDKEPLKFVIQGHFRALVSQLLQGEGIQVSGVDSSENWLDIVASLAWQAANFVKPDTRRGGSMDPVDYVKVKCIASGIPIDSSLIKGVVCTKNIKHKRMTTQYKNPRLLLLGGALEYRSVTNQLASFNTLVQEENDHLKMIISKIEALRPNVLLVEKNVSPYAQEYLLTKEISLVPNVKKPLMERIARCTGALISPSIDTISTTRLGNCELFRVERFLEEHELANQFNKKPTKTLMFFEGCPRRLGCTVLLRGSCCDELKKVKDVVQYAVFAAYHLSLETSFLADEGASLPKMKIEQTVTMPADEGMPVVPLNSFEAIADYSSHDNGYTGSELVSENIDDCGTAQSLVPVNNSFGDILPDICHMPLSSSVLNHFAVCDCNELKTSRVPTLEASSLSKSELLDIIAHQQSQVGETLELEKSDRPDGHRTVCERSRLLRIKFYGSFDKPLGRYLRDDLFDQTSFCRNCKEPAEAHVLCYTHQQGNLTINVRSLSSMKLPGEQDGKIWMWHRCLRCAHVDGVPPSTRRVIMSDAAWGLSFGKFLELSFSNHATADRVAPCGHSLQKDCLRFYGFGSMVGFFRYSPIDILNVHLPPSVLEFTGIRQQEWIRKEAAELLSKVEVFYSEISNVLDGLEERSKSYGSQLSEATELQNHILELKVQLMKERNNYSEMLKLAVMESLPPGQEGVDILDLNRTRRSLIIDSRVWDRQIYSLDSLLKTSVPINPKQKVARQNILMAGSHDSSCQEPLGSAGNYLQFEQGVISHLVDQSHREDLVVSSCHVHKQEDAHLDSETSSIKAITDDIACDASNLSDRIDSAWTGTDQRVIKVQELDSSDTSGQIRVATNSPLKRMMGPVRVNSFDSALRVQERIQKGMPLSNLRSFHASGDYRTMLRDPVSNTLRTSSQAFPLEVQKSNILLTTIPSFISSASDMMGGARLLLPHRTHSDVVIGVYDDDPASIVSYALNLKEHEDWVAANKSNDIEGKCNIGFVGREDSAASTISGWQSYGSMDLDYMNFGSDGMSSSISNLFTDSKKSPHFGISYNDASGVGGKVKYSVTCYFANQFHSLRKKCCPGDVDFVRSLSRCQKWSAQGGKSNVYFAKSLDERFIIKQVKKTELESFEEFAPEYFKYVTESLNSRSPTCLAKILGIYQVAVKHLKSGRETKMDLMVMENLFFRRTISRVYDLKGSARSRYNPDSSGVLLDMNLVEELRTEPIFLGSKAKRSLERAIWNDTSFLAVSFVKAWSLLSVDVMDYSLLVGVDEEKKELVLGIIDFMRQYTWDKHLETWVKASGILGGPKNASPTIISPVQYKKRFRKAMTSYFLTVPDQWSTS